VHAKTAMLSLFNYLNNYPLKHDVGGISSNAHDIKAPQGMYVVNDNNSIINVNDDYVSHERGPERGVRMVIRDESGKYCWKFTPCSIRPRLNHKLWMTTNETTAVNKKPLASPISSSDINANNTNTNTNTNTNANSNTNKKKSPIASEEEREEEKEESKMDTLARVSIDYQIPFPTQTPQQANLEKDTPQCMFVLFSS
ncbi:ankyrin repeat-containing protein, partial [Reticulomyxa filosa]